MVNEYDGEYFVFGVNTGAWGKCVYGSEVVDNFCVLFKKVKGRFIPHGEASEIFRAGGNDHPDCSEDISDLLKESNLERVFTCDVPIQKGCLLNLVNRYVPENWDYERDPYPSAEVYYGLDPSFYGEFLDREGSIKVIKVDSNEFI